MAPAPWFATLHVQVYCCRCWARLGSWRGSECETLPFIEQSNGTSWTIVPSPQPPTIGSNENDTLSGVTVVNGTSAWAVGNYNASTPSSGSVEDTLVEHWDGTSWTVVPSPNVKTVNLLNAVTSFQGQTGAVGFVNIK